MKHLTRDAVVASVCKHLPEAGWMTAEAIAVRSGLVTEHPVGDDERAEQRKVVARVRRVLDNLCADADGAVAVSRVGRGRAIEYRARTPEVVAELEAARKRRDVMGAVRDYALDRLLDKTGTVPARSTPELVQARVTLSASGERIQLPTAWLAALLDVDDLLEIGEADSDVDVHDDEPAAATEERAA